MRNGLSVDVEDYFHAEAVSATVTRERWDALESRVVLNTHRVLELLARRSVRATFFVLGWVAERFPALVREIHSAGHELGCHSYWHRLVYTLTPEEFREDTARAKRVIEDAAGVGVLGYRAPTFSLTHRSRWAVPILAELGFRYDSSIFPVRHDYYGIPDHPRFPLSLFAEHGVPLYEFPLSTWRLLGMNLPFGGGGYLRVLPWNYTRRALLHVNRSEGQPVIAYFHPWELDPEQPRFALPLRSRLRHYTNLHLMAGRVSTLLDHFQFVPLRELLPTEA